MKRQPHALGAHLVSDGVHFSLFSANATHVELVFFSAEHEITQTFEVTERTGKVWHRFVPGATSGQRYAYRVHGPWAPEQGHRFNARKVLLDPYARVVSRMPTEDPGLYGHDLSGDDRTMSQLDGAHCGPVGMVTESQAPPRAAPRIPWTDTIIYETHVRGLTMRHPEVPPPLRGTFLGAASEPVIDHLLRLGVTTIELLPIHAAVQDARLLRAGLAQYWGYNTLSFFAPDSRFTVHGVRAAADEFRAMVDAFHAAGLEIILDVVFNHTGEGDQLGPTLSFRGIDNASYYVPQPGAPRTLFNCTGCGNTLRAETPHVKQLIMDSLRYWTAEMGVDGFRFDLAPTLLRERRDVAMGGAMMQMMLQDPVLKRVKLIAEPWDAGPGGYRTGSFPAPWREWNDRYRDGARRFWLTGSGSAGEFATRLAGSSDLFGAGNRLPSCSINFVTCHDGFTLEDVVSYQSKHNDANGEGNRDGASANHSTHCGIEGPTSDPAVLAKRDRLKCSLLSSLLLSQGVPMILGGDELGRTQHGNNNAFCQDNEVSWYNWELDARGRAMLEQVRQLIAFRKAHPGLRQRQFLTGNPSKNGLPDAIWWHPNGREMTSNDWAHARAFALELTAPDRLVVCFNGTAEPQVFVVGSPGSWIVGLGDHAHLDGSDLRVPAQSVVVLTLGGARPA